MATTKKKKSKQVVMVVSKSNIAKRKTVGTDEQSAKERAAARMDRALKAAEEEERAASAAREEEESPRASHGIPFNDAVISLLESINEKLEALLDSRTHVTSDIKPLSAVDLAAAVRKSSLVVPEKPAETQGTPTPSPFYTDNGVRLEDEVYVVFSPAPNSGHEARIYEGVVTAITPDGVSVLVPEDETNEEYDHEFVFLRNEQGRKAAEEVLSREKFGHLEAADEKAQYLELLLSEGLDTEDLGLIPYKQHLIPLLAKHFSINNFALGGKGEERKQEIIDRIKEFKSSNPVRLNLMYERIERDKAAWKAAREANPNSEQEAPTPKATANGQPRKARAAAASTPDVGHFIREPGVKDWYRIQEVRRDGYMAVQKNGMKKLFKHVTHNGTSFTKTYHTPIWDSATVSEAHA